ncbi:MAG TPA: ketopantoate reductase family protein, partial [Steroidobacteraceae bacterium]|nr:ketopantoate reductase family protein [Steroidobacteraceae bacterium]
YFGGRLLKAKRDVTFLVRPRRAAQLQATGLSIRSALGDVDLPAPPTVQAQTLKQTFDLVLLSAKAYDLENAIESFAPAVGPNTAILPLLNGMKHLEVLEARFGGAAVLGGQCFISASLDAEGRVLHLNKNHSLSFGERGGAPSGRANAILAELANAGFEATLSEAILQDMWDKWVFIATAAGMTCLMRAAIGDIVAADGPGLSVALLDECAAIASSAGFPPRKAALERSRADITAAGSLITASMLRDIERGAQTEVEQILGDLFRRQSAEARARSLLHVAYAHVKAYEARRTRELNNSHSAPR